MGVLVLSLLPATSAWSAERAAHADLEITGQEIVAGGHAFAEGGVYEKLTGTMSFALDPDDPRNAVIVDLDKAPRNAEGLVEYDTDFFLLRPRDTERWNGKLAFEVNNRGNKRLFNYFGSSGVPIPELNAQTSLESFGNGFLLNQGYAVAWAGWEADVLPGADRMTIRVPVPTEPDGSAITERITVEFHSSDFAADGTTSCLPLSASPGFASYPAALEEVGSAELRVRPSDSPRPPAPTIPTGELVPPDQWRLASDTEICLEENFQPGNVYELSYVAKDPRVMGLGFAATRDVVSFLRTAQTDVDGDANPLAVHGGVTDALGIGISSSGMYLRSFIYQGFNEDLAGRPVFDGVNIHIPGAHKLFLNYRFSQPNPYSTQHRERYVPYVEFPFNYGVRRDPVSGAEDGILKRPETDPLVIHTDTSTEYWQFQAALVDTDGFGNDVPLPANVRGYLLAGTQHGVTPGAEPALGMCQQLSNPTHAGPALRALFVDLDQWVSRGVEPPESRRPTVASGTLVATDRSATGFPLIPGVEYNGLYNDAGERDLGARAEPNRGVIDNWTNPPVLADYEVLVPKVNEVGIDLGGLDTPSVGVPTATLTGWNLRRAPFTEGDLCGLSGMWLPLAVTEASAAEGDSRPTLEDLYGSRRGYVDAVRRYTRDLVAERLLLPADARAAVREAEALTLEGLPSSPEPTAPQARAVDDACPAGTGEHPFTDVAASNPFAAAVGCLLHWDVTRGTSATTYEPGALVTRQQMAGFIARLVVASGGTLPDGQDAFADDEGSIFEADINRLASAGIVHGTGVGTYSPTLLVTRAQMAALLVRAYDYRAAQGEMAALRADGDYFPDDAQSPLEEEINAAAAAGFAAGHGDGTYRPADGVRREHMAAFLTRVLDLIVENSLTEVPTT